MFVQQDIGQHPYLVLTDERELDSTRPNKGNFGGRNKLRET